MPASAGRSFLRLPQRQPSLLCLPLLDLLCLLLDLLCLLLDMLCLLLRLLLRRKLLCLLLHRLPLLWRYRLLCLLQVSSSSTRD